jgi:hypothetical protein
MQGMSSTHEREDGDGVLPPISVLADLMRKYADIALGYAERLPKLEDDLADTKSAALAALGVSKEAREVATEARDAARETTAAVEKLGKVLDELRGAFDESRREVKKAKRTAAEAAEAADEALERSSKHDVNAILAGTPAAKIIELEQQIIAIRAEQKGSSSYGSGMRAYVLFAIAVIAAIFGLSGWLARH